MPLNVVDALRTAIERLGALPAARSDAEELIGRLLQLGRAGLYLERERVLSGEEATRLDAWLERRVAGEPVQYITGRAAFRGLELAVDRRVLIPRPETEGLVEAVLGVLRANATRWSAPRVLDLGTGSGAIALALAHEWPAAAVTATDASAGALEVARANARSLALEARVQFLEGDWLEPIPAEDKFEVMVSNPPYIATGEWGALPEDVRAFEPAPALFSGSSGLDALREIVDEAPIYLVTGGLLALELAEMRAHDVAGWFEGAHDWGEVRVLDDLAGRPRVLLAIRQSGPAIAPTQWPEERA